MVSSLAKIRIEYINLNVAGNLKNCNRKECKNGNVDARRS